MSSAWTYNPRNEQWESRFTWACGVEGHASVGIDPATNPRTAAAILGASGRDCPDCRKAELDHKPVPEGHHPQHWGE